jgi:solute:Na+ symporter, SSS family
MFTSWDWIVLIAYLAGTTWLADRLAARQQTVRDFFLGGRRLSWKTVAGSIVATEISGVTFVVVPALVFANGGDYRYLMLAIGSIAARVIIGYAFVPAYYKREIYSPYEFMGKALGPAFDRLATVMFFVGGFLAQGARLFLAGLVLDDITGMGIGWSVATLAGVSVLWTWIGGITSVVWTDIIQFAILFLGAIVALIAVAVAVPGGVETIVDTGRDAGKLRLWDFTLDRTTEFTFWCGLFGTTFLTLGSHGTDQMMAQRLFCCRSAGEARKAIIASSVGVLLAVMMLTVGLGLHAYFERFPMSPADARKVAERGEYVFPVFIRTALPVGVRGLLFAAIFSAATATGTLAAMAQAGLSTFYLPFKRRRPSDRHLVFVSRVLVLVAALGLTGVAIACESIRQYRSILSLALAMAGYTYGPMLGMLLLALMPRGRNGRGLVWGAGYSILLVLALNWRSAEVTLLGATFAPAPIAVASGLIALAAAGLWVFRREPWRLLVCLLGAALVAILTFVRVVPGDGGREHLRLVYCWHYPLGTALTLAMGYALGRRRSAALPSAGGSPTELVPPLGVRATAS